MAVNIAVKDVVPKIFTWKEPMVSKHQQAMARQTRWRVCRTHPGSQASPSSTLRTRGNHGDPGRSADGAAQPQTSLNSEEEVESAGKSEPPIVCAGQRVVQEGSSPSDARMRSVISEGGGNASLAEENERYGEAYTGTKAKAGDSQGGPEADLFKETGGQGVHREVESEGHEEKYRAVIDGGYLDDEPVGQRWGQGRARTMGAKAFSFTHRTKVFADGTVRKNNA